MSLVIEIPERDVMERNIYPGALVALGFERAFECHVWRARPADLNQILAAAFWYGVPSEWSASKQALALGELGVAWEEQA